MKRKHATSAAASDEKEREASPTRKRALLLVKKLVEQAKLRAEELRREMEAGKKVLLDALDAEKENMDKDGNVTPQAFTISVRCVTGLYRGRKFSMEMDMLKMETTGKIFFIDLDSTNGSRINDVELEPHEPFELTPGKPIKVEVGAGELEFMIEPKS
ncbi:hypothetical protein PHYBOEH_007956 [Phytophthora boehmeriae]|uniref:FHA domain-containing protein n=1 Tax=Phytophthora boehmeriae TaxID=109152 RepID=A0A8T1X6Y0_9STRA|nr:hypothetical protein PHYBOEH_007956 [Phytophthora boehmeriae]